MVLSILDTMALEISDALSDYSAHDSTFYEQAPVDHFATDLSTPYSLMMSAEGPSSPASATNSSSTVPPLPTSSALKKSGKAKKNVTFLPNCQIQVRFPNLIIIIVLYTTHKSSFFPHLNSAME